MGQVALHNGFYDRAVEWIERAIAETSQEQSPSIAKEELSSYLDSVIKKASVFNVHKQRQSQLFSKQQIAFYAGGKSFLLLNDSMVFLTPHIRFLSVMAQVAF
ncbi:hypothetical protein HPB48_007287 [Haemaphysalis longicornis]|uniref:Uncharacterized protein n=1 Tax=Haemaphysalis longicornis TaxID=44386 RepID=A0A9J6FLL2_HAELO|nr:hypothetical protein HPB48_007287 [Haemaphysalis longicornis]